MELNVTINCEKLGERLIIDDPRKDIPKYLNCVRYPNHSAVAMYNEKNGDLDILRVEDEYELLLISELINDNPSILEENEMYCVAATSCASFIFNLIRLQGKLLKSDKTNGKKMVLVNRKLK